MDKLLEQIKLGGIVPVVVIDQPEDAVPLARALEEAGLTIAEVTLRTDGALQAIRNIVKANSGTHVGAGTVLNVEQAKSAIDAGASFVVSPGLNPQVVEFCLKQGVTVIPGFATPSEASAVLGYGLTVAKFFPAEVSGGVEFLKALSSPFKDLNFIPTGGIDENNLLSYLRLPRVIACGGSWMVRPELIRQKQFDEIKKLASQAVSRMLGFELRHVGMNCENSEAAQSVASTLSKIMNLPLNDRKSSVFVGTQFELLKSPHLGTHGHIAIGTNFIDRAIAFLSRLGIKIRSETRVEKDGQLSTVYLDLDLAGFAVHLLQS